MRALRRSLDRFIPHVGEKFTLPENTQLILIAAVIGVLSGLLAVVLRWMIGRFQVVGFGAVEPSAAYIRSLPVWLKLTVPTVAGLGVGLITRYFASEAKGHGVPEVMEAIAVRGG